MRKLLIGLLALVSYSSFANNVCSTPNENAASAFNIIENKQSDLCKYLDAHLVAKTARNEKCETMYYASIRNGNMKSLSCLDSI